MNLKRGISGGAFFPGGIALFMLILIGCNTQQSDESLEKSQEEIIVEVQIDEMTTEVNIMQLTSPVFEHNGNIPSKHTCYGDDISPALRISGVPSGTKTLALIMDDPDAQPVAGKTWDHWIIFNIPPTTMQVSEGQEPPGVHGKGTGGNLEYHGPC